MELVGPLEILNSIIKRLHISIAEAAILVDLPVVLVDFDALLKQVDGLLVAAQQIQRPPKLFEILDIRWIQQMALLKKIKTIMNISLDPQNQCFQIQGIFALVPVLLQQLINKLKALPILLPDKKDVYEPVRLLPLVQCLRAPIEVDRLPIYKHDILLVRGADKISGVPGVL